MNLTAILQINEPYRSDPRAALQELASFALSQFGKGGNPNAREIENHIGYVNTAMMGDGYVRTRIDAEFAESLETLQAAGGHPVASLVRVERHGQDMVEVDGEIIERPITWQETYMDEGVEKTRTVRLGRVT